jgi:hypothetical protein
LQTRISRALARSWSRFDNLEMALEMVLHPCVSLHLMCGSPNLRATV